MREIARDLGKRVGQGTMGADLREARGDDGARETSLRERRSLCRAGLHDVGISDPALNTPIFAASRVAGWCAHVVEQHDHNRLIRPRSLYTGPGSATRTKAAALERIAK